jgi:hypothetical protein
MGCSSRRPSMPLTLMLKGVVGGRVSLLRLEHGVGDLFDRLDHDPLEAVAAPGDGQVVEPHGHRLNRKPTTKVGQSSSSGEMPRP